MPPCSQCNISFVSIEGAQLGLVPTQRKMLKIKPEVTARGKDMSRFMASNRRHPFEILSRLRHPSGRFKEMLFALSYTLALLGFFCFMNKVADEVRPPSRPVRLVSQPSA